MLTGKQMNFKTIGTTTAKDNNISIASGNSYCKHMDRLLEDGIMVRLTVETMLV